MHTQRFRLSCGVLLSILFLVPACGMADLKSRLKKVRSMPRGGYLTPDAKELLRAVGPLAEVGVQKIAETIERTQFVREVREAVREFERVQRIAIMQQLSADGCDSGKTNSSDDTLSLEALTAFEHGEYIQAQEKGERDYKNHKAKWGAGHARTIRRAATLAMIHLGASNHKSAIVYVAAAVDGHGKILGGIKRTNPPQAIEVAAGLDMAKSLNTMALIYNGAGAYPEAVTGFQRALDLRSYYLGADHVCVAQSKNHLGELYQRMGNFQEARRLFEEALAMRMRKLPPGHRDIAQSLNNLASYYKLIGSYSRADEYYRKALDSRRRALGDDDLEVAESFNDLGDLYRLTGDYVQAERNYQWALAIRMRKSGNSVESAQSKNALAVLYQQLGDLRRARAFYEEALAIRQRSLPADHPDIAESLNDLGDIAMALGDYQQATDRYQYALTMREQKLGDDSPQAAASHNALAGAHLARGNYDRAEAEYNNALAIRKQTLGSKHPDVAQTLHWLAVLYQTKGNYQRAEALYTESLALRERVLGGEHPDVAESLTGLATLMALTRREPQAVESLARALRISEHLLRMGGMVWTESRIEAFVRTLRVQEEIAYSLAREPGATPAATTLAISMALLRKGRSVDKAAEVSRTIYQELGEEDRKQAEELQGLDRRIVSLTIESGGQESTSKELKDLEAKADVIKQNLATLSPRLRTRSLQARPDDVLTNVAKALGPQGALVEIVAYRPYFFRAKESNKRGELHYLALVLRGDAKVHTADLGPGKPIDDQIKDFLRIITRPLAAQGKAAQLKALNESYTTTLDTAKLLYKRVFAPVRPFLDGATSTYLSLDSQLHLLPFNALHDGKDFLIDNYLLIHLTSGRDLLRGGAAVKRAVTTASSRNDQEIILIAKPEFIKGGSPTGANAARNIEIVDRSKSTPNTPKPIQDPFWIQPFSALEGTAEEVTGIKYLLPKAKILQGSAATKEAFLDVKAPAILHVATHGYFREGRGTSASGVDENAMINSMLFLAGAGVVRTINGQPVIEMQPEGLVTALDVAHMNLWGTQLVVLSACDTGRGEVRNLGQGVYGLRRAMIAAGAETLVTSLWQVDDHATRDLMGAYYWSLIKGKGRAEAMSDAAKWLRWHYKHPLYWASFVVIGTSQPLDEISALRRAP